MPESIGMLMLQSEIDRFLTEQYQQNQAFTADDIVEYLKSSQINEFVGVKEGFSEPLMDTLEHRDDGFEMQPVSVTGGVIKYRVVSPPPEDNLIDIEIFRVSAEETENILAEQEAEEREQFIELVNLFKERLMDAVGIAMTIRENYSQYLDPETDALIDQVANHSDKHGYW